MNLSLLLTGAATTGSLIAGGVYANFSARVMPRLAQLPTTEAVSTMQQFNRTAVQAPFMTVFFGSAVLGLVVLVRVVRRTDRDWVDLLAAGGAALYLVGFVLTIVYNVPRNDRLAAVDANSPAAVRVWSDYLRAWTPANSVRAVASLVGAGALAVATLTRAVQNP